MNAIRTAIEQAALNKGTIHSVEYVRDGETRAKNPPPARIRKRTVFSMRIGHSYYNQTATKEAHESGERAIAPNPDIIHLSAAITQNLKNGRICMVGQPIGKPEVVWEMGGISVQKSEIEPYLLASECKEGGKMPDHISLDLDKIVNFK